MMESCADYIFTLRCSFCSRLLEALFNVQPYHQQLNLPPVVAGTKKNSNSLVLLTVFANYDKSNWHTMGIEQINNLTWKLTPDRRVSSSSRRKSKAGAHGCEGRSRMAAGAEPVTSLFYSGSYS